MVKIGVPNSGREGGGLGVRDNVPDFPLFFLKAPPDKTTPYTYTATLTKLKIIGEC